MVAGEAWLFLSLQLLAYACGMAIFFHLFVTGYEEPTLQRRFGAIYEELQAERAALDPAEARRGEGKLTSIG